MKRNNKKYLTLMYVSDNIRKRMCFLYSGTTSYEVTSIVEDNIETYLNILTERNIKQKIHNHFKKNMGLI